jgi:hypothetical protein
MALRPGTLKTTPPGVNQNAYGATTHLQNSDADLGRVVDSAKDNALEATGSTKLTEGQIATT